MVPSGFRLPSRRNAATVMTIFSLYALASPYTLVCGTMIKARGRGGTLLRLARFQVLLVVPSVIIVAD